MKTLIYCTKGKPKIYKDELWKTGLLNGKVVALFELGRWKKIPYEQDFEEYADWIINEYFGDDPNWKSGHCLTQEQLKDYGKGKDLYAWHIDNLQVFDEPIELGELYKNILVYKDGWIDHLNPLTNAPQSYQYVFYKGEKCLLLSVKSEWVAKILQGEKTVEIRKTLPKEVR